MEIWPNYFEPKLSRTLFSTVEVNISSLTKHILVCLLVNFFKLSYVICCIRDRIDFMVSCRGQNISIVPLNTCMSNKEYNILWFQIIRKYYQTSIVIFISIKEMKKRVLVVIFEKRGVIWISFVLYIVRYSNFCGKVYVNLW